MAIRPISPEVAQELAKSSLPHEAIMFMAALSSGEIGPHQGFRTEFGGGTWTGSLDSFPDWGGNREHNTTAVGAWQDVRTTWETMIVPNNPGITFHPQDQIRGNWWLAKHDYASHTGGGDLLAALQAGDIEHVGTALIKTWPGGAALPGLADTYRALMAVPPPNPTPAPAASVTLYPGEAPFPYWLAGYAADGTREPVPIGGELTVDDPSICDVTLNGDGQGIVIVSKASGTTQVHYALAVDNGVLTADLTVIVMTLTRIAFVPDPFTTQSPSG